VYAKSVLLISGHIEGQEFTLVGDIVCSENGTDIESIELLFGTFISMIAIFKKLKNLLITYYIRHIYSCCLLNGIRCFINSEL
jgi:hypothetical protein